MSYLILRCADAFQSIFRAWKERPYLVSVGTTSPRRSRHSPWNHAAYQLPDQQARFGYLIFLMNTTAELLHSGSRWGLTAGSAADVLTVSVCPSGASFPTGDRDWSLVSWSTDYYAKIKHCDRNMGYMFLSRK